MKVRTLIWSFEQRMAAGDLTGEEEVLFLDGEEVDWALSIEDEPNTVRVVTSDKEGGA